MDPRLDYIRDLERRDAEVAARIDHVLELGGRADELHTRTGMIAGELARLPERRERAAAAAAEAERELAAAREALVKAEREGASGESAESARRRLARAESELRAAEGRRARLVVRLAELDREGKRLRREVEALRRPALELAAELEREPRIASTTPPLAEAGLALLQDWASGAHAGVLVARSGLQTERGRIVREAYELATSVLAEPPPAMSVASMRERLETVLT